MRRVDILRTLLAAAKEEADRVPELDVKRDLLEVVVNFIDTSVDKLGPEVSENEIEELIVSLEILDMSLSVLPSVEATIAEAVVVRLKTHLETLLEAERNSTNIVPVPIEGEIVDGEVIDEINASPGPEIVMGEPPTPPAPETMRAPEREPIGERNDFERFLKSKGIPETDLDSQTPPGLTEKEAEQYHIDRYSRLRSYFHASLVEEVWHEFSAEALGITNITETKYRIDRGGTTISLNMSEMIGQMMFKVTGVEARAARKVEEQLKGDLNFYAVLLGRLDMMKNTYSHEGIEDYATKEKNTTALFGWFWQTMADMPPFATRNKETGEWIIDKESMGEKIFKTYQDILRMGRRLTQHDGAKDALGAPIGSVDESTEVRVVAELKNIPHELLVARHYDKGGHWSIKELPYKAISRNAALPMHLAGTPEIEKKQARFRALIGRRVDRWVKSGDIKPDGTPIDPLENPGDYHGAEWSVLLAYSLADVMFETSYQDSPASSADVGVVEGGAPVAIGKPTGIREVDRLSNPGQYAYKTLVTAEQQGGKYNAAFINNIKTFFLPYTDYFGWEGMTLTEQILACNSLEDFKNLKWANIPKQAASNWFKALSDALSVAKIAKDGFPSGGTMRTAGKAELESLEISNVNTKFLADIKALFRTLDAYIVGRDSLPTSTMRNFDIPEDMLELVLDPESDGRFKKLVDVKDSPTNQFVDICIYDEIGNPVLDKKGNPVQFTTRIHQWFHLTPDDLARWVDGDLVVESGIHNINTGKDGQPVMVIRVKRNKEKPGPGEHLSDLYPKPKELIMKELMYRIFYMTNREGDIIKDLKAEDLLIFGMFLSAEMRDLYVTRHYQGPVGMGIHGVTQMLPAGLRKIFTPELPNFESANIYSAAGYEKFLIYMGYDYRIEDLLKAGERLFGGGGKHH